MAGRPQREKEPGIGWGGIALAFYNKLKYGGLIHPQYSAPFRQRESGYEITHRPTADTLPWFPQVNFPQALAETARSLRRISKTRIGFRTFMGNWQTTWSASSYFPVFCNDASRRQLPATSGLFFPLPCRKKPSPCPNSRNPISPHARA